MPGDAEFDSGTRKVLSAYDVDGDGKLTSEEIANVVDALVQERYKAKVFKYAVIAMTVFAIVILGASFGLTWAVVSALKDTKVRG